MGVVAAGIAGKPVDAAVHPTAGDIEAAQAQAEKKEEAERVARYADELRQFDVWFRDTLASRMSIFSVAADKLLTDIAWESFHAVANNVIQRGESGIAAIAEDSSRFLDDALSRLRARPARPSQEQETLLSQLCAKMAAEARRWHESQRDTSPEQRR